MLQRNTTDVTKKYYRCDKETLQMWQTSTTKCGKETLQMLQRNTTDVAKKHYRCDKETLQM